MLHAIIDDGWTERGYVAEAQGLHPACRFEYRPLLRQEAYQISREIDRAGADQYLPILARHLAAKLVSWDLTTRHGDKAPINEQTILRLRPRLFERLVEIVWGREPSDVDPATGRRPDQPDLAAAEKN